MNIHITARYGDKWGGTVSHEAYGAIVTFSASTAFRPEPIRCPVSVFRSAVEIARPLATLAARKEMQALELAAIKAQAVTHA